MASLPKLSISVPRFRCLWCDHTSDTERGVLLHEFSKHPFEMATLLIEAKYSVDQLKKITKPGPPYSKYDNKCGVNSYDPRT